MKTVLAVNASTERMNERVGGEEYRMRQESVEAMRDDAEELGGKLQPPKPASVKICRFACSCHVGVRIIYFTPF